MTKPKIKTIPKLTKEEVSILVQEREQELAAEQERAAFEKSLRLLVKRMEKKGFYIGRKLFAHLEKEEATKWIVNRYKSS